MTALWITGKAAELTAGTAAYYARCKAVAWHERKVAAAIVYAHLERQAAGREALVVASVAATL